MRILFTFTGGEGHLQPLLTLARAAVAGGHEVTVSGAAALRGIAAPFAFVPSGPDVQPQHRDLSPVDEERERAVVRDWFAGAAATARASDLVAICGRLRPDLVVWDEIDFGAAVAAERCGIPHASVIVIAAGGFVDRETVGPPLERLRAAHGLPADPELGMLRRHLVLDPFPAFGRAGAREAFGYRASSALPTGVGPDRRGPGRPLVYVTLGTVFNTESGDLLERIVAGVAALPVRVVVAVGHGRRPEDLGPQPPSVEIVRRVDQEGVLGACAAVVCHAGSGTVTGALARGVPVVCLPLGADQPANASRCVALGVGIALDAFTATPAEIARALTAVLEDPGYVLAARRLADGVARLPPVEEAIGRLEQLVLRSRRVGAAAPAATEGGSVAAGVSGDGVGDAARSGG